MANGYDKRRPVSSGHKKKKWTPEYLRAIPAKPEGIYRSRLEARFAHEWSVDFPEHPALYEPYRLSVPVGSGRGLRDTVSYLPDFVIPSARMVVEVKPCPSFIEGKIYRLVDTMAGMGWMLLCWSGKREGTGWPTPWSIMGDPYRLIGDIETQQGPYYYAGGVDVVRCAECKGPSPDFMTSHEWQFIEPSSGDRVTGPMDQPNWRWVCWTCGAHQRFGGPCVTMPRAASFPNIYSRPKNA